MQKKNCARQGSDQTLLSAERQQKKNLRAREVTGRRAAASRKKIFLRAVTGQSKIKNLQEEGTGQEKVLREKKRQVTDLRPVKKVLRD
jgi:hypothetical protein